MGLFKDDEVEDTEVAKEDENVNQTTEGEETAVKDNAVRADVDSVVDENHTVAAVDAQGLGGTGPVNALAKPNAATVKQAATFTIEVPFNPQLVEHYVVVQNVEREIRKFAEVVNFEVGEVKDWVFKHLTLDEKIAQDNANEDVAVNSDTPGGVAAAQSNDKTVVKDAD